jgi:1-acyl-sn-glycerol-3-phosphate acyltransferase
VSRPPEVGRLGRSLGALYLRLFGWRVEGRVPEIGKAVLIAAPHTSGWDLPFMLATASVFGVKLSWLGKRELFRWPFRWLFRRLGGLPVDRGSSHRLVEQAVDWFTDIDRLFLAIAPSGTRRRTEHWKSGFYHIARGAGVPVMCTFLDYRRKVSGIGPTFMPSGNVRADMDVIRRFYADITSRYPELTTPVHLLEEDDPNAQAAPDRRDGPPEEGILV